MKLREKFNEVFKSFVDCNFIESDFADLIKEECEIIADDYAIDFAKWIIRSCNHDKLKFLNCDELLILFKEEQGL